MEQQARTSTWNGALEINALALHRILVVTDDGTIHSFMESAPGDPIMLYWQKRGHYMNGSVEQMKVSGWKPRLCNVKVPSRKTKPHCRLLQTAKAKVFEAEHPSCKIV